MNDNSFTTTLTVDQSPEAVFATINDPRGWWAGTFEGKTHVLGAEFSYRYEALHFSKQRVTELVPGRKVVWTVTDSALQFAKPKDEWTGTKVVFDITRTGEQTEIRFQHVGLLPDFACYGPCSRGWTHVLRELAAHLASQEQREPKSACATAAAGEQP